MRAPVEPPFGATTGKASLGTMPLMNTTTGRIEVLAAARRAIAASLPPSTAPAALATIRAGIESLPDVAPDADAERVAELAPLLATLERQSTTVPTSPAG